MRVLLDATDTYVSGKNTGIQRVVRKFVNHSIELGPSMGIDCFPVIFRNGAMQVLDDPAELARLSPRYSFRVRLNDIFLKISGWAASLLPFGWWRNFFLAHRNQFGLARILYLPLQAVSRLRRAGKVAGEWPVRFEQRIGEGDLVFLPDSSWSDDAFATLKRVKDGGGKVVFFVHDIIPLTHPQVFERAHVERFRDWFGQVVGIADGIVCNSRFTQQSIERYLGEHGLPSVTANEVVHLGHDLVAIPGGIIGHDGLRDALSSSCERFLFVGTLEPRKNLDLLIDAFEILWEANRDLTIILIGRAGWLCEKLQKRLRRHAQRNSRLFWFDDIGDSDLSLAYGQVSALILPSIVEGFGLPLVEALGRGVPVIASDIPVFREVAGDNGRYFSPTDPRSLASAISDHLATSADERNPDFDWPSWEESTRQLLHVLQNLVEVRSVRERTEIY